MRNIFDKQYENLAAAYRKTIYSCLDSDLDVRIDQLNPDIDRLFLSRGYECLSILTTYNPGSVIQTQEENRKSQTSLIKELEEAGYEFLEGINYDPKAQFPDEHTCWVLGMRKWMGLTMARKWNQKAFVHCRIGEKPELVWVK